MKTQSLAGICALFISAVGAIKQNQVMILFALTLMASSIHFLVMEIRYKK